MRRVLTLLDGTDRAASILPDAMRIAGTRGEIILLRDVSDSGMIEDCESRIARAERELDQLASSLNGSGPAIRRHVSVHGEPLESIVDAIQTFEPDVVAAVTHARTGLDRFVHGSVSWWLLEHSPVPVLLRHVDDSAATTMSSDADLRRNILVPLDGSDVAESALPLACMLATEWEGVLSLVQVVPGDTVAARLGPNEQLASSALMQTLLLREARSYLAGVARSCAMTVNWAAVYGKPVETLSTLVREWWITDVVMGSHGRIGLDRITLGSVAEDLIKSLKVPVIVVPGTATGHRIQPRSHALGALTYVRT